MSGPAPKPAAAIVGGVAVGTSCRVHALATYRPVWQATGAGRAIGPDEDVLTLAVAAARPVVDGGGARVERVVLVTRAPDYLEPDPGPVLAAALELSPQTPVEQRLGGGPAALAALAEARPGTLVVAVSPATPAGAAAALLGSSGTALGAPRTTGGMLPASVRSAGVPEPAVYDDPRLVRERATLPALAAVSNGASPVVLAGVGAGDRRRLGANDALASEPVSGAAEPLFALASAIEAGRTGPLIAVESASAAAVDVGEGSARVVRTARPALAPPRIADPQPARIPLSLPAYARAFDAKVGLRAARCACGALSYPPRSFCPACRTTGRGAPEPLPRACSVYTTSTIHTPVPGIPGPYSLAIVALDGVEARFLVHITGAPAGSVRIGDEGELVLRRIAVRDGVPDYGYGFEPAEVRA